MLEASCLLGCSDDHITYFENRYRLQGEVCVKFEQLVSAGASEGFDICIASGFRSYQHQREIWNAKATGKRTVLDDRGAPIDLNSLDAKSMVFAILRWSALPGASRHHWGTDFDIYDAASLTDREALLLTVEETEFGGPFYNMYCWLEQYLSTNSDFFRPYAEDRGGVACEPWHLSYSPFAQTYLKCLDRDLLFSFLKEQDFALKEVVIKHFDEIYDRFIANVCASRI